MIQKETILVLILYFISFISCGYKTAKHLNLVSLSSPTADMIATANQLTNQRLVCVLDACALGAEKMELVLNRAFPLR